MVADRFSKDAPEGADRKTMLADSLRRRILTMRIAPGAVLDEVVLGEEFGLSRPPVRETMRQLAGEGFIELETNRAARVTSLNYHTLRDFFLIAPMIYAAATRLAAEHATSSDIAGLREIQDNFRDAVDRNDVDGRVYCNDRFHLRIGEIANNVFILPSLRRLAIEHARIAKIFYKPNTTKMVEELWVASRQHDEIIDAIANRDADRAENIISAHLDLSRQNMAMYTAPEGMQVSIEV